MFEVSTMKVELNVDGLPDRSVTEIARVFDPLGQVVWVLRFTVQVCPLKTIDPPLPGMKSPAAIRVTLSTVTERDHGSRAEGE